MKRIHPKGMSPAGRDDAAREYLFDMLDQMAKLARQTGENYVAIHLEAIKASWLEVAKHRSV